LVTRQVTTKRSTNWPQAFSCSRN